MSTRRPFVAGNWKLNLGPAEASHLAAALAEHLAHRGNVDVAVFPTAMAIPSVVPVLAGTGISVGVQDIEVKPEGAFTGANSAVIARAAGCTIALCGHSERRQLYGDNDERIGARVRAAHSAGLLPILCVGETLDERRSDHAQHVVFKQLSMGLAGLTDDQLASTTVAYEPVWAIGTGETATPEQAQAMHHAIRAWLAASHPRWASEAVRILYGGSVTANTAPALLALPDVDGALVGGASLDAASFAAIVRAADK